MKHLFNWIEQVKFVRKKLWVKMIRTRPAMLRKKNNPIWWTVMIQTQKNIPHKHEEQLQPTDLSANKSQVNKMIFTDLVTNIRIKTTKTNRQQYQWLRTLAELKDFFGLTLERQGTWSQRQLKGTNKGKNSNLCTHSVLLSNLKYYGMQMAPYSYRVKTPTM